MQLGELRIHAGDTIRFDSFASSGGRERALVRATVDGLPFIHARLDDGKQVIVPISGLGERHVEVLTQDGATT